jgi:hypothetical protein
MGFGGYHKIGVSGLGGSFRLGSILIQDVAEQSRTIAVRKRPPPTIALFFEDLEFLLLHIQVYTQWARGFPSVESALKDGALKEKG